MNTPLVMAANGTMVNIIGYRSRWLFEDAERVTAAARCDVLLSSDHRLKVPAGLLRVGLG
jgi:hypothetical protein